MSEKLDRLISLYDSKASDDVTKATDRFNKFKAKRSEMVKIDHPYSASAGGAKFSTVGEVLGAAITESGSLNDVIFRNIVPSIFQIDSEYREVFQEALSLRSSVRQLQRANDIKEKGGKKYLDELMRSIGSLIMDTQSKGGSKFNFSKIVEKGSEEFSRLLNRIDDLPDAPRGISSSLELFDAVVESGDPIEKIEAVSSINENEAEDTSLPEESTINENEAEDTTTDLPEESTINDEKESTDKRNAIMAKSEAAAGITTTPSELPKAETEEDGPAINDNDDGIPDNPYAVAGYDESVASKTPEVPKESAPINEAKTKGQEKLARIKASAEDMKKNMSLNDMLASITNNVNTTNSYISDNPEASSQLNTIFNNSSSKSDVDASSSTTDGDKSSSSINSNTSTTGITNSTNNMTSVLNSKTDFKANGQDMIDQLKAIGGVDDKDIAVAQAKIKAAKVSRQSKSAELPVTKQNTEVSKESPALPAQSPVDTKTTEKETNTSSSKSNETIQVKEVGSSTPAAPQDKTEASQVAPAPVVNIDLSQLDVRLSRIEYALSNTLEVKIVE